MIVRNRTWLIGQSPDERVRQRTLPVAGGDGATVSFDFVGMGGVLDSRWTFSRAAGSGFLAGTGPTYIGADGLVKYATTNQPRFDYDPTTLAPRGLLIEGSAVNAALNSTAMRGTGWVATNLVTPSNAAGVTDPANGTNSTNYIANSTTGYHGGGVVATTTGASTTAITWSCWVRANGYTKVLMAEGNTGRGAVSFEIDPNNTTPPAPTVVGGAGSPTGTITRYPNNWYRIAMRVGVAPATAYQWGVVGYPTGATLGNFGAQYTGDSTNGIYVWGAMLEDGFGASSYIPTGSAAGTREQDTASFADAAAIGFDRRKGTLYFSGTQFKHASSFARSVRLASAPGGSEPMGIAVNGSTFYGTARDASFVAFGDAIRTNTLLQPFAFAVAFNADTPSSVLRGSLNGSSVSVTQSSAAAPPTAAAASMDLNSGSGATAYASMAIRSVKFWPTDKSLSELTSITS